MIRNICFILCSVVLFCRGAELLPRSHIHVEQDETIERGTSATISVQRFDGKAFYNYVKLGEAASHSGKNRAEAPASGRDGKDAVVFFDHHEDDAESPSTTLSPTTTADVVVVTAAEGATQPPSGNLGDSPSATGSPSGPSDSADGGSVPSSPTEGGSEQSPNPGDAVPGQGEDADAESSSSSSEESSSSSSSSSSSEEDEHRSAWQKAWQHKLRNELIMRTGKSKDMRKIYPNLFTNRFLKI